MHAFVSTMLYTYVCVCGYMAALQLHTRGEQQAELEAESLALIDPFVYVCRLCYLSIHVMFFYATLICIYMCLKIHVRIHTHAASSRRSWRPSRWP
jgi:hypothetical protein